MTFLQFDLQIVSAHPHTILAADGAQNRQRSVASFL
jgi:hypothetical protein